MEFPACNQWFAIQVRSKTEKSVSLALSVKGYEEFLPLYQCKRGGGSETIAAPLFPGYLFCRFNAAVCGKIVTTPGVIRIVGCGSRPFPVSDEEIQSVRRVVDSQMESTPWPYIRAGQYIYIMRGPLAGLSGFIVRIRNRTRIVVSISLLQRSVAVEVDGSTIGHLPAPSSGLGSPNPVQLARAS